MLLNNPYGLLPPRRVFTDNQSPKSYRSESVWYWKDRCLHSQYALSSRPQYHDPSSKLVDSHTTSGFQLIPRLSVSRHPENSLDRSKRSSTRLVNSLKSRVVLPFQDHGPETKKSTSTFLSVPLVPLWICSRGEEQFLIRLISESLSLMRPMR